ncbi:MAG: LysR substrate-binding domain-containing protein [Lentilitoribacter sp.]
MEGPIRIRQLEALNALADHGSMTKAADSLKISQPAVSRLLADLTKDLGFKLFHRKDGRIHLTQEARFLLPDIRRVLESMSFITEAGRNLSNQKAGHIRIACLPGFATSHLPAIIAKFMADRPGVTITVEPDRPERILEWIVGEQFDCGITDGFDGHPAIEHETISVRSVCIFKEGHPLGKREVITPEDMRDEPIIHTRRDSSFFGSIDEAFNAAGVPLKPHIEIRQFTAACELVKNGAGLSIVSELDARSYTDQGVDFRPFEPGIPHKLSLVRPIHRHPSKLTLEFMSMFEESLKNLRMDA